MNVEWIETHGSDLSIANAARVSLDKWHSEFITDPTGTLSSDARLLDYLVREGHESPFFHAGLSLRITAPIFVARQLMRSTVGLSQNEVSRRYVSTQPRIWHPETWRQAVPGVKQGSGNAVLSWRHAIATLLYRSATAYSAWAYRALLGLGVCNEQARAVLPQGMMTTWIWTGSIAAFARVCRLRQAGDAQAESCAIAGEIATIAALHFPYAWQSLMRNGR